MKYHLITNTDIEISTLCLGTMTFGDPVNEKEAIYIVDWAIDHGINFAIERTLHVYARSWA